MPFPFHSIKAYVRHFFTAKTRRGDGVHSPFIFSFITDVKNEKHPFYAYKAIENVRKSLLNDSSTISVTDYGTGSSNKRKVCDIAKRSCKPAKQAQLLFRIVNTYQPQTIFDLGTCLGTTTLYMAKANQNARIHTFEGCPEIAKIAQSNFTILQCKNIVQHIGDLKETLPNALQQVEKVDLVFFDANHQKEPTLAYFEQCLQKAHNQSIFIFDDIHWSKGMEEAWNIIRQNPRITVSLDLYHMGILFFSSHLKPAHYKLKF